MAEQCEEDLGPCFEDVFGDPDDAPSEGEAEEELGTGSDEMNQPGPSSASSNEEQWQCLKFYHVHSVVKFLGCTTMAVSIVAFVMLCYIAFSPEASQSSVAKSKFEVYQDFDDVFYRMRNEWHFSRFFKGMFSKKTGGSKKKAINLVVGWKILMGMSKTLEGIAEGRVEGSNNRFSRRFNDADRAKLFAAVIRKHVRSVGDERSADFLRSLSDKLERIAMARCVNEADLLDSIASLQALDGFWRTFEEPKELKNLQQWTLKLIAHLQDILKEYEDGMRGGDGWLIWSVLFFVVFILSAAITSLLLVYGAFRRKPGYMIPFLVLQGVFVIYKSSATLAGRMDRWEGKVAVVTGTSAGIGVSIATELVERGMVVVGLARRVELVEELAASLAGKGKGKLHAVRADVGKEEDVVRAFQWVREHLGAVHVLINNAGYAPYSFLSKLEREQYQKVQACFDTNVMGVIMCSNEAIKLMREKGIDDGHIININSIAGHFIGVGAGFCAYNASKFALTVITEGLRRELAEAKSKIRMTSISPGAVDTNMGAASDWPDHEKYMATIPALKTHDVTASVVHALAASPDVQIAEVILRPVGETI
ncbi:uncharacterized protein LOC124161598 [Ischnura elegans]|uniref:uncharacterized protein LOC124161598 n=1 Tax=Ischnura elegans TaxID=197161 RepID=UPI001ED89E32|nr:uncharacterized protein LOC124161598 [Ischnura elegans]